MTTSTENSAPGHELDSRSATPSADIIRNQFVASAVAASDLFAYAWDLDADRVIWDARIADLLGPMPAGGDYPGMRALIHPEDRASFESSIREAQAGNGKVWASCRFQRTDGAVHWVVLRGGLVGGEHSARSLLKGIIADVNEQKLIELEAQKKLNEYREVLDHIPDRVWSKDCEGRFTTVNRAYADFHETTPEQLIGRTNTALLPPGMLPRSRSEDAEVLEKGCTTRGENVMFSRGREYRFEVLKSPLRDASGRIIGITGLTHDITERVELQESLAGTNRELETLLATCPAGIAIVRNRVIERCNPAAAAMLGYSVEELIGQATRMLYPDDNAWQGLADFLYKKQNENGVPAMEVEFKRKDGSRIWVLVISHLIDAATQYTVSSLVDISEQKKLSQALIEAKNAADDSNRAKSNFLATMSHEIRTPMNGVLGMLELMESTSLDAGQRETLHVVRDSANALLGLIDGVLDFSKIESGQLDIHATPFDLRQMATQCLMLYRESASKRGLSLEADVDAALAPCLIGDSLRIRQIINNLFSNAIKFTSRGLVTLCIRVQAADGGSQTLSISVKDTGIGIDSEVQERLFQPFVQAEAGTTRRYGGTGLGLSICKHLTDAMGGTLILTSAPGAGTTVTLTLTLPLANQSQTDAATRNDAPAVAPAIKTGRRVLVAEDHPVNLRVIARQLKQLGFESDLANDGREALALWKKGDYAALISDCHMPEMDGYELSREIRAAEAAAGTEVPMPIIACTASALAEEGERCLAAGMNDVMVKPVSVATLQAHLAKWVPARETTG
jgi:PAS domain S-box-containing protein